MYQDPNQRQDPYRAMTVFPNLLIPMEHHHHNLHSHYNRTPMVHQHKILMVQVELSNRRSM